MIAETLAADHDEMFEDGIEAQSKSKTGVLDKLIHKALIRSYLVTDDLLAAFPEAEENMAQLEEIFIQLINQGIEVYSDAEEAEEERRLKEAPLTETQTLISDPFDLSGIAADDTISLYLKEMARVPLLAPTEEIMLAKTLERGRKAQKKLNKNQSTEEEAL